MSHTEDNGVADAFGSVALLLRHQILMLTYQQSINMHAASVTEKDNVETY